MRLKTTANENYVEAILKSLITEPITLRSNKNKTETKSYQKKSPMLNSLTASDKRPEKTSEISWRASSSKPKVVGISLIKKIAKRASNRLSPPPAPSAAPQRPEIENCQSHAGPSISNYIGNSSRTASPFHSPSFSAPYETVQVARNKLKTKPSSICIFCERRETSTEKPSGSDNGIRLIRRAILSKI
ncbi:hypothetical protein GWI33_008405 [Rhynchophorus ferrugineus]|uniref:Uncharacterized protein n=1 Tax=Rhynchophorus ferrugineus TaxID=354439 RepID=A0A834MC93_RHYFE|nr:hypothetical protein GWI33_008405 [Rhynchophorus ferrugineus]